MWGKHLQARLKERGTSGGIAQGPPEHHLELPLHFSPSMIADVRANREALAHDQLVFDLSKEASGMTSDMGGDGG